MNAFAGLIIVLGGYVLSILTTLNAYGLSIVSWSWLIWGTLGALVLLGIGGAVGKR